MRLTQNQTKELKSYQQASSALRKNPGNMRNIVNKKKFLIKRLGNDVLLENTTKEDFKYGGAGQDENHHGFEVEAEIIEHNQP